MRLMASLLSLLFLVAVVSPVAAGTAILMDYSGFAYETGGVPSSEIGDILVITGVADQYDPLFGVAPSSVEVTVYIYGLVSDGGWVDPNDGRTYISYSGGGIAVYEDSILNHDWGMFPPNAELPTFTDGQLLFSGDFTSFSLTLDPSGIGGYEGNIDGVGGTAANICDGEIDCAYTFGGSFGRPLPVQLPDGYDLQITGTLEVDAAVPTETASFGAIKSLFQN